MQTLVIIAALGPINALETLHALLDSHPRGLRKVAVAQTSYGRGLVATGAVAADEACLRIPYELCAVEPEASADGSHWASRMASRVVTNDLQPAHKAYLPPPPDVLTRWPDEAVDALGDPSLSKEADEIFFWRDAQWAAHTERHPSDGDREAYVDALDAVCSRTVRCGDKLVLAPLLDLANHKPTEEGGCAYVCEADGVALYTTRALEVNDEVCLDYGSRSNGDWLLHCGFLPSPNRDDSQWLGGPYSVSWADLPLAPDDDRAAAAREALEWVEGSVGMSDEPRRDLINEYRAARRRLLAAACGAAPADAATSAFR